MSNRTGLDPSGNQGNSAEMDRGRRETRPGRRPVSPVGNRGRASPPSVLLGLAAQRLIDAESALRLQRSAGNAAVAALLRTRPAPVVQRDIGFEMQVRENSFKTNTGRSFGRKAGKFFHGVNGLELQSETGSFLEFETGHFQKWSGLEAQMKAAVDVVKGIKANPTGFPFNQEERLRKEGVLRRGEKIEVDIKDGTFLADLQWTEGVGLSQYGSMLRSHERSPNLVITPVLTDADKIINDARAATRGVSARTNVENLRGFLQIILNYVRRGQFQTWDKRVKHGPVKSTFRLLMRTSFSSAFQVGLSAQEKKLFAQILASDAIPKSVGVSRNAPFFKLGYWAELDGGLHGFLEQGKVTALSRGDVVHECPSPDPVPGISARDRRFCGTRVPGANLTIGSWLTSIAKQTKDSLSPAPRGSGSMGSLTMQSRGREKGLVVLEVRDSQLNIRQQPVDKWVDFAETVFSQAAAWRTRHGTGTGLEYDGKKVVDIWAAP